MSRRNTAVLGVALSVPMFFSPPTALAGTGCVTFSGLEHCPVGNAVLEVDEAHLVVSNIGSTGNDGVSIAFPSPTEYWHLELLPLGGPGDTPNGTPDGAFIEVNGRGVLDGVPNQIVTVSHHEVVDQEVIGSLEFLPVEPAPLTSDFYCDGVLVHTETTGSPRDVRSWWGWLKSLWPDSFAGYYKQGHTPRYDEWGGIIDWQVCADVTTPQDLQLLTDLIEVRTEGSGIPFAGYSGVTIIAKDVPSITIVSETVKRRVPTVSAWGLVVMALLALTGGTILFGRRRSAQA